MIAMLSRSLHAGLVLLALAATLDAQARAASQTLTSPSSHFGHEIGADYVLPDYTQFMAYWQTLARPPKADRSSWRSSHLPPITSGSIATGRSRDGSRSRMA
jgi:hypothetical protein